MTVEDEARASARPTVADGESDAADETSVERFLEQLALAAVQRDAPHAHVAVSVVDGDSLRLAASSDARVAACETVAIDAGAGPSIEAVRRRRLVLVRDLATDARWPAWDATRRAFDLRSAVAVPSDLGRDGALTLTLYAHEADAWDVPAIATAAEHARQLGRAIDVFRSARRQAEVNAQLKAALASRATIDQAMGVIMAQNRCTAQDAFAILRTASQHRNTKLRDVAASVIEGVTGRPAVPPPVFRES